MTDASWTCARCLAKHEGGRRFADPSNLKPDPDVQTEMICNDCVETAYRDALTETANRTRDLIRAAQLMFGREWVEHWYVDTRQGGAAG